MTSTESNPDGRTYQVVGDRVAWRQTDDEAVVLDLEDSVYYGLNPTGVLLWKRLAAGATRRDLVGMLVASGAPAERASADVDAFLTELGSYGLLTS
ncbi:PqqD family protein [Pengzhenrongella sicca]|uniref:PqqD family protein n=1 Tax=Pengzhenrongella sicca TaxID=2819238 RepID=A0A8A4ZC21_9MICO|nr:PqqD family protein [Pengzhenrongella sicca]QTE29424.1 PqqD family protein [Pengzhenrongella sicca]